MGSNEPISSYLPSVESKIWYLSDPYGSDAFYRSDQKMPDEYIDANNALFWGCTWDASSSFDIGHVKSSLSQNLIENMFLVWDIESCFYYLFYDDPSKTELLPLARWWPQVADLWTMIYASD